MIMVLLKPRVMMAVISIRLDGARPFIPMASGSFNDLAEKR